ncbi:M14/M99 family metallopeptidase [Thermodesulfobacteriota bacterium]
MIKTRYNKEFKKIIVCFAILFVSVLPGFAQAQKRVHSVFFEGTDYELNVYRIYGKIPGKTLLLIGGIQGDEPGAYLSVDHYADMSLERGNLIVVPRANFQSILLKRRKINEDMNRKFADDHESNYEAKVVSILKKLILESDCLLNLHDGSGFFSEKWKGPQRNPKKLGQSIIADCETYVNPKTGQKLALGAMARSVSEQINKGIENADHHFHFNNHKTKEDDSLHKEQRKSATYFALFKGGVPAFGIETSKSLPLEMKVRHHNLAINAFMEKFGIIPETPGINIEHPILDYLVVSVNDSLPVVLKNQQKLSINKGDTVMISHIESNYDRGLSADITGYGTINDIRKKIRITKPARVIVRKDYYSCGWIDIAMGGSRGDMTQEASFSKQPHLKSSFLLFKTRINGKETFARNNERVKLIKGDTFELVDVFTNTEDSSDLTVNFKGYVGNPKNNTGEDRGYVIHTAKNLWKRYSLHKKGKTYQVIVTNNGDTVGKLFVGLEDPALKYIVLGTGRGALRCLTPGDTAFVDVKKPLEIFDINTNIEQNLGVKAFISVPGLLRQQVTMKEPITVSDLVNPNGGKAPDYCRIEIERDNIMLGSILLKSSEQEMRQND